MLWKYLKTHMLHYPNQKICESDAVLTYEQVIIFAEEFSKNLKGQACCAIYCKSEMSAAIALLACFAAGVTAVPVSQRYGDKHCLKILETVCPTCVITDSNSEITVTKIPTSNYIKPKEHPAVIMFTSGTTGVPKGVMLSERNLISNIKDISDYFKITNKDSILISRPIYHVAVITGEFLISLILGVRIHFYSEQFNPIFILNEIKKNNISTFCTTPTLMSTLSRFVKNKTTISLSNIVISGECLNRSTANSIRKAFPDTKIYCVYGLTEASPRVCYLPPEQFDSFNESIGVPLNSVEVKVVDQKGHVITENGEGILWVHGPNIMMGYYNDPNLTKKVLKKGWLCTNDIVKVDVFGRMYVRGRNDNMIIRAGMNIYPQEIEAALKKDSRVNEVLVYEEKTGNAGSRLCLNIAGDFKSTQEVQKLCKNLLPAYQMPTKITLSEELPKTCSGKIIRGTNND